MLQGARAVHSAVIGLIEMLRAKASEETSQGKERRQLYEYNARAPRLPVLGLRVLI